MMRLSVFHPTRVVVSALGLMLVAVTPLGAQEPQDGAEKLALAESVITREEAASERAFDAAFRAKTKELLAALPLAELASQTGGGGLGLNSLGDTQADLVYTPVTPCRIIDTRLAGGKIAAGATRSFKVTGDTTSQGGANCGIPYGPATSAMINFVAVEPTAPGDLRITPFGTAIPLAAILNWAGGVPGLNLANGLAVALCNPAATTCTNDITLQADASAIHVVADVQGYFQRVTTGSVGTALLADAAVTAPKIGAGVVVRSLNGLTDAVTLAAGSNVSITPAGNTLTIAAPVATGTSDNIPGAIVARDGSGSFSAGTVELAGNLALPSTTSASVGVLTKGGARFLHDYGAWNVFLGYTAGNLSLTGSYNTAVGAYTFEQGTSGVGNAAFGAEALRGNTTGGSNAAFGEGAAIGNTAGSGNAAFGNGALGSSSTGDSNSAFGTAALAFLTSGSRNTVIGVGAGQYLTNGSNNVYIDAIGADESNTIRIGGVQTATYIAGISGQTSASGVAVYVASNGKLGTATSSRRYKEQITDMSRESEVLLKLRPVSFYYRPELDETHLRQYGLVAEEVAEVAPGLVAYDKDGTPQTVRYHFVNAMLLNEVQKQRRLVEEQQTTIEDLKARLTRLEAALAGDR